MEAIGLLKDFEFSEKTKEVLAKYPLKKYLKGETLFREKEEQRNVFLLLVGHVSLYKTSHHGKERIMFILNPKEWVNEVILDGRVATVSGKSFTDSTVLAIPKEDIFQLMVEDHFFLKHIYASLAKKTRRLYRQIKNTVLLRGDKKLAAKLWKLGQDYGESYGNEWVKITLKISITDLGNMLGTNRETTSRWLSELEKNQLVFQKKKVIFIQSKKLLEYFTKL